MKRIFAICFLPLIGAWAFAQGPGMGPGPGMMGPGGGFGGWGGRGPGMLGAGPGPHAPVTGQPYAGTEVVTRQQLLSTGNQIARTQKTSVARDRQGRMSTTETITPPAASGKAPFTIQTIFDPVAGNRYVLDSSTMTAIQEALPKPRTGNRPAALTPPTPPARPNVTTTSLAAKTVNGVMATGTQITETIPAGAVGNAQPIEVVRITWISTDLKVPVQITASDPRFGTTDMELMDIVQGDPDPSLFIVPAGYTVKQGHGRGMGGPGRMGHGGPGGPAPQGGPGPHPVQ